MKTVASLSEQGWIHDSNKILNNLMSYYILSDSAQSLCFQGNIINLPETYYKYINDPEGMCVGIKQDLDSMLSRYFQLVDVVPMVKSLTNKNYAILLYVSVIDYDNVKIDLSKVVEFNSGGLRKVIDVNNRGNAVDMFNSLN